MDTMQKTESLLDIAGIPVTSQQSFDWGVDCTDRFGDIFIRQLAVVHVESGQDGRIVLAAWTAP